MKELLNHEMCNPTIIVLIGMVGIIYLRTVKHLFISRCKSIDCCGVRCERDVINQDDAVELASTTTQGSALEV